MASLYKKGGQGNPENHRPISVLNVAHILMAYIVHDRISSKLDTLLGNQKSGFRKGRSTINPIRLKDIVEQGHDRLVLVLLLNREKDFD